MLHDGACPLCEREVSMYTNTEFCSDLELVWRCLRLELKSPAFLAYCKFAAFLRCLGANGSLVPCNCAVR